MTTPLFPTMPQIGSASPARTPEPLREAARDLHEQFLTQMLRASGFGEALKGQAGGQAGGEAAALADLAFADIAEEMANAQPQLTERLYTALRRGQA